MAVATFSRHTQNLTVDPTAIGRSVEFPWLQGRAVGLSGERVQGLGFRVQGSGFRVLGLGLRLKGLE